MRRSLLGSVVEPADKTADSGTAALVVRANTCTVIAFYDTSEKAAVRAAEMRCLSR